MKLSQLNFLYIADIVGKPGFNITSEFIGEFKDKYDIDVTIANGENAAAGKGLTPKIAQSMFDIGIDVITSGNHIWNKPKIIPELDSNPFILRPLNYPSQCPGHGSCILEITPDLRVAIINLQGRSFMFSIDCPFKAVDEEIKRLQKKDVASIVVDFHAEATAEKIALAWYLDGRVTAVIGSHTHVQTADERIFPKGTAYITDAGMTGPFDSVIGMEKNTAIKRFMTQLPDYYKIAQDDVKFCGVVFSVDLDTKQAISITRFQEISDVN